LGVNNSAKARFAGETSSAGQSSDHADDEQDTGPAYTQADGPATGGRPALHLNLRHDPNGKSGLGANVNFSRAGN